MTSDQFMATDWIDQLARTLGHLAKAQEPYLQKYWEQNPRVHIVSVGRDSERLTSLLDDLARPLCHGASQQCHR